LRRDDWERRQILPVMRQIDNMTSVNATITISSAATTNTFTKVNRKATNTAGTASVASTKANGCATDYQAVDTCDAISDNSTTANIFATAASTPCACTGQENFPGWYYRHHRDSLDSLYRGRCADSCASRSRYSFRDRYNRFTRA
jgi:hypothetical protein